MGKKSRLKRERRESKAAKSAESELFKKLVSLDGYNSPIYRFFPEEWQADALCEGNVWISTLETCRAYEDPLQGDPEEATHTYESGHIVGGSADPAFIEMAARSGVHIGAGCSNITISGCSNIQKLPDAFVLCTTQEFKPESLSDTFGQYCVKISNPLEYFKRVSIELNKLIEIREGGMGLVQYKDRVYTGLEAPPDQLALLNQMINIHLKKSSGYFGFQNKILLLNHSCYDVQVSQICVAKLSNKALKSDSQQLARFRFASHFSQLLLTA